MDTGKRLFEFFYLIMELFLIGVALWPTCLLAMKYAPRADSAMYWVLLILGAVLVFNYAYLFAILVLRVVIPLPKEGFFPRRSDGSLPREAILLVLNLYLVKARFQTPWAAQFSSAIVNIFPLS